MAISIFLMSEMLTKRAILSCKMSYTPKNIIKITRNITKTAKTSPNITQNITNSYI